VEIFESDEDDDSSIAPSGRPNNILLEYFIRVFGLPGPSIIKKT
jgi:hypothetical protein